MDRSIGREKRRVILSRGLDYGSLSIGDQVSVVDRWIHWRIGIRVGIRMFARAVATSLRRPWKRERHIKRATRSVDGRVHRIERVYVARRTTFSTRAVHSRVRPFVNTLVERSNERRCSFKSSSNSLSSYFPISKNNSPRCSNKIYERSFPFSLSCQELCPMFPFCSFSRRHVERSLSVKGERKTTRRDTRIIIAAYFPISKNRWRDLGIKFTNVPFLSATSYQASNVFFYSTTFCDFWPSPICRHPEASR